MPRREHPLKIGVSGIRGVVGEFLTPALACAFGQAFGTYVGPGRVVVGRDTRSSGEMLQHAVQCGLLATGCEVIDVGILPTPTIQMYAGSTRARGGLALTASHNPPEYNALKLFNGEGLFFNNYERSELVDLFHQSSFRQARNAEMHGIHHDYTSASKLHIDRILNHVNTERIRACGFQVGLDAVNGAGSVMSCRFLRDVLHCELEAIAVDPAKPFPRVAEPRPDTLGDLAELVKRNRCDVGFAQDPDADRLAVVDETGRVLDNDDVLALVVDAVLERLPGNIVVNLSTSSVIDDIARAHGRCVYRTPVGEANVVEMMQSIGAVVGGEGSNGGIIFPAVHLCRDSFTGMAFLLERMAETGDTVSALAARLPRYHRRFGTLSYEHGKLGTLMQAFESSFRDAIANRSDGLKMTWPGRWVHVRASNTEPLLRLAVEARSEQELEDLYGQVLRLLEA
jgi:phosphomannomutase